MANKLSRMEMLEHLPRITFEENKKDRLDEFSQVSLADSLLLLAELDYEHEYDLCRQTAQHLLGNILGPDDATLN